MHFTRSTLMAALPLAAAALVSTGAARAQDEPSFPKVTGSVGLYSDYRFRGVSLSNLDPAVQGSLQITTKPGFFVAVWASSIAEYGATEDSSGATVEVDLYGGWSGPLGPVTATVGVYSYLYPGGTGVDAVEFYGAASLPLGPVTATVGLNWAPDQKNLSRSSRYAYGSLAAAIPNTPITLKGSLGNEKGSFVVDESGSTTTKWDWLVGADVSLAPLNLAPLTLGIAYVGNDLPRNTIDFGEGGSFRPNRNAKDGFVISLSAAF